MPRKGSRRTCEICGVKESHLENNAFFACFPLDESRCREWVRVTGNEDLLYLPIEKLNRIKRICANHFKKKDFNKRGNRLKKRAVPLVNLTKNALSADQMSGFPLHMSCQNITVQPSTSICQDFETTTINQQSGSIVTASYLHGEQKVIENLKGVVDQDSEQTTKIIHNDHAYCQSHTFCMPKMDDDSRSQGPEGFHKEEQNFYPTSEAISAVPEGDLQIKRIVEEGQIDHNLYISEVVDEISHGPDTDLKQLPLEIKSNVIEDVRKDVIHCFEHVSTMGLSEDDRKNLTAKHLVLGNCMLYGAPTLNPEVKAALSKMVIERDQAIEYKQALLASAIASLVEAIGVVLSSEDNKTDLLQLLVDTGRLLCDCQHNDTVTRRNCILDAVDADIKETLQNSKSDSYLFGNMISLPHNLKINKVINKIGSNLTSAPRPNIAKSHHRSGSAGTKVFSLKRAKAIHKPDKVITLLRKPITVEAIASAGITLAPSSTTVELIRECDAGNTLVSTRKTVEAIIHNSSGAITLPPRPIPFEAIDASSADITSAPELKAVEGCHQSVANMTMSTTSPAPGFLSIHKSSANIHMVPQLARFKINKTKKQKSSLVCSNEIKEVSMEVDENLELNPSECSLR